MIKINLAPPTGRNRQGVALGINLGIVFGAIGGLLVVALGTYAFMLVADVGGLHREIAQAQAELARLKPIIAEGQRDRQEKAKLERRVNAIEMVARNQSRPAYLLDALADMLPANLWLTRVEETTQHLKLAGTTYSSVALSDFMANLRASGTFKEVDLVESRQDLTKSPRTITFEVTCRFEI